MLLPLHDRNPLRIIAFQAVTATIICLCVVVFLIQKLAGPGESELVLGYGFIPAVVFDVRELSPALVRVPEELTVLTSLFLHGGWGHLLGNMLFLWIFGDNIEDSMGHLRFALFYLVCGAVAALTHGAINTASEAPLIGASGAIAGVMGAYLVLHPKVKILFLALYRVPLILPAYLVLLLWLGFQVFNIVTNTESQVAWWAHIAGFVAGALLVIPLRRKGIALFDRGIEH